MTPLNYLNIDKNGKVTLLTLPTLIHDKSYMYDITKNCWFNQRNNKFHYIKSTRVPEKIKLIASLYI